MMVVPFLENKVFIFEIDLVKIQVLEAKKYWYLPIVKIAVK